MNDILQVRTPGVSFYVLRWEKGLYLIDAGFIGGLWFLKRVLGSQGWSHLPICGILLTHGHLDHVLNVSSLMKTTGAWVAGPLLDGEHFSGQYPYKGLSRVCGLMEATGKRLLNFRPFGIDRWLHDGETLPIFGGLSVIHLPGHTIGHCSFYIESEKILFCGDLFASYGRFSYLPSAIYNDCPQYFAASLEKASSLDLNGVLPNHCGRTSAEIHLK
ncbi:MAG: MBL fold metallo-hydrolase, partial [Chthoniobacterales bacterium]